MSARCRIRRSMIGALACTVFAAAHVGAQPVPSLARAATPSTPAKPTYIVSGLMRKTIGDDAFMLVHSWHAANSADEATGAFVKRALAAYPGYSVAGSLASPSDLPATACPSSGTLSARSAAELLRAIEAHKDMVSKAAE